ncbi:Sentrin-specific protease 5 [Solea senegalensis]|uniref:Sentrin-specific protease 5 n=1 Tax=Solea senegalensis TaxID=28829 RepID=A0AAV6SAY0_SOLSE|nr:sentrin-specific protease 5 [Solea senegalensis]KAG7514961.1 Sentrin-specific protease 5 [Solea senegalensis]
MVHSGSASPMTTPSESPHLTVPATAPPLVPPSGDSTVQDQIQPPAKLLSVDLTANSDETQSSSPSVAEPPDVAKTLKANSQHNPTSSQASPQTPTPAQGHINGRTSGRKRTPKACDCCGPNGTGHNVKTLSRGRGKGKGSFQDLGDTPKRKASQLTHISNTALTKKKVQETEDESKTQKTVPKETMVVADTQPHTNAPLPVTSLQDVSKTNCAAPEKEALQKKEDTLIKGLVIPSDGGKVGGGARGLEIRVLGNTGRGATVVRGRGIMGAKFASNMKVDIGIKKWSEGVFVIGSKMNFPAPSVVVQSRDKSKVAELERGLQTNSSMVTSSFGNGETVNLSDSEPEGEDNVDNIIMSEQENGPLSFPDPEIKSGTPQDHDSEMQVDQKPDHCSLVVTLSNGITTTPTDHSHGSTPMEVERGPITVTSTRHHWALRDHKLYCRAGTWANKAVEEMADKLEAGMDGQMQNEDRLMQLIDMVHEFLEAFYLKYGSFIPLTETDVVEHLKKNSNSDFSKWGLNIKGEMTRYKSGLASAPIAGFMVMHNKHTLSLEDLGTLEEQNWLNDQIINMYGELIMETTQHKVHFFNSFFHKQLVAKGYEGVKRWTKKVDLFSKWLLLIPIHLEIHWSLVTVTMATKTISYYDSQGIVFRHTTDNIMKYLQSEAREKELTAFQKGWKITIIKGIPQQKNDSDCGVFVLEYCRRLSVKQPLLFSQEDMPRIRKRIYKELCDCRLND